MGEVHHVDCEEHIKVDLVTQQELWQHINLSSKILHIFDCDTRMHMFSIKTLGNEQDLYSKCLAYLISSKTKGTHI